MSATVVPKRSHKASTVSSVCSSTVAVGTVPPERIATSPTPISESPMPNSTRWGFRARTTCWLTRFVSHRDPRVSAACGRTVLMKRWPLFSLSRSVWWASRPSALAWRISASTAALSTINRESHLDDSLDFVVTDTLSASDMHVSSVLRSLCSRVFFMRSVCDIMRMNRVTRSSLSLVVPPSPAGPTSSSWLAMYRRYASSSPRNLSISFFCLKIVSSDSSLLARALRTIISLWFCSCFIFSFWRRIASILSKLAFTGVRIKLLVLLEDDMKLRLSTAKFVGRGVAPPGLLFVALLRALSTSVCTSASFVSTTFSRPRPFTPMRFSTGVDGRLNSSWLSTVWIRAKLEWAPRRTRPFSFCSLCSSSSS
eukprot:PhM_4_TR15949/c0_g1_i1/m.50236